VDADIFGVDTNKSRMWHNVILMHSVNGRYRIYQELRYPQSQNDIWKTNNNIIICLASICESIDIHVPIKYITSIITALSHKIKIKCIVCVNKYTQYTIMTKYANNVYLFRPRYEAEKHCEVLLLSLLAVGSPLQKWNRVIHWHIEDSIIFQRGRTVGHLIWCKTGER